MGWNPTQQKVIAILPKFSSFASLTGSSCIIAEVLYYDRRKLTRVYHRLLLAMSIYDVIESSWNFASSWPIPRDTTGVAFASGTTTTCTIQGFVLQFGLAIPILNMFLSVYYLLVIKYGWSEEKIRRKAEPYFQLVGPIVALSTCVASLPMELFNNANTWCWIAPLPLDCQDSYTYGETNCIRGDNAWIYRWAFYYAELWFCILFVMFAMLWLYKEVRDLERANLRYSSVVHSDQNRERSSIGGDTLVARRRGASSSISASASQHQSKSRRVAAQALWYVGAFYVTFLFATINRLTQQLSNKTYFSLTVMHVILEPCQGFFNYLVYLRPRFVRYMEKNPQSNRLVAFRKIMFPDDETFKSRRDSTYVDDDHEDEESAREELRRWRFNLSRAKVSGILRLGSVGRSQNRTTSANNLNTNDDDNGAATTTSDGPATVSSSSNNSDTDRTSGIFRLMASEASQTSELSQSERSCGCGGSRQKSVVRFAPDVVITRSGGSNCHDEEVAGAVVKNNKSNVDSSSECLERGHTVTAVHFDSTLETSDNDDDDDWEQPPDKEDNNV